MQIESMVDSAYERMVLRGAIMDREVVSRLAQLPTANGDLLRSSASNLILRWAISYFKKHKAPIGVNVSYAFAEWKEKTSDNEITVSVATLLKGLSDEADGEVYNSSYTVDVAQKLISEIRLERTLDAARGALQSGDLEGASKLIRGWSPPALSGSTWFDMLNDVDVCESFWDKAKEPLFYWHGDLQEFFGPTFSRDKLVVFRAIAKAGKTFALLDVCYRALAARLKVAFFCVGDMSEEQVWQRWAVRVAQYPRYRGKYRKPIDWDPMVRGPEPVFRDYVVEQDMTVGMLRRALQNFQDKKEIEAKRGELYRTSVHAGRSLNVFQMESILEQWEGEGFVPDVVIVDYVGMLGWIPGQKDQRISLDETWVQLRAIGQRWHSCIVTASQSDAEGYDAVTLGMRNFSGTRTENDNASAIICINQSDEEERLGVQRWNMLLNRDIQAGRHVWVAGSREIGCQTMISKLVPVGEEPK